jgi:hypothetical protein
MASSAPVDLTFQNDVSTMQHVALVSATAKAKEASVLGGEIARDMGSTLAMLKRPFSGAVDLLGRMTKAASRNAGKTAKSAARAKANAWLEYRYGWRPLISDVKTIVTDAQKLHDRAMGKRLVFRSTERQSGSKTVTFVDKRALGILASWPSTGSATRTQSVRVSAGVIAQYSAESYADAAMRTLGLRLCDVPSTAWEIIPFSFVVDWSTNVGKWIRAVTPVPGINILGNWVTTIINDEHYISGSFKCSSPGPPPRTDIGDLGSARTTSNTYTRAVNQPLPTTPDILLKPLTRYQEADALALTAQKILNSLGRLRH